MLWYRAHPHCPWAVLACPLHPLALCNALPSARKGVHLQISFPHPLSSFWHKVSQTTSFTMAPAPLISLGYYYFPACVPIAELIGRVYCLSPPWNGCPRRAHRKGNRSGAELRGEASTGCWAGLYRGAEDNVGWGGMGCLLV